MTKKKPFNVRYDCRYEGWRSSRSELQKISTTNHNAFVAGFIGESNIVDGVLHEDKVVSSQVRYLTVDGGFGKMEPVDVVIRPEDIKLVQPGEAKLQGVVKSVTFIGVHYEMIVEAAGIKWLVHSTLMEPVGSNVGMIVAPMDIHIMKKVSSG